MTHPEQPPRGHHAAESDEDFILPSAVLRRAEQVTTARLEHAYYKLGDALLAYLTLSDVDPGSDHLEDDFHTAYRGDHATLDEAIHTQLDSLGWTQARQNMLHANGIEEHMLVWDLDLIKARMDEVYDFVEYNGRTYQFIK